MRRRCTGLMNAALAGAVERALAGLPPGRRLRILEVGAGTGGTTSSVLPRLPRERTDYVFTDVSAGFFGAAEERFGSYPFVSYRVLDIERDPREQGFAAGAYDLVVASNVLHATRDIAASARHCRSLLAPGGELVLLEELQDRAWYDLTFGLLDGWWRFADAPLRSEHALLDASGWRRALGAAGFAEAAIVRLGSEQGPGLVLARSPLDGSVEPGLWVLASDRTGDGGSTCRGTCGARAAGRIGPARVRAYARELGGQEVRDRDLALADGGGGGLADASVRPAGGAAASRRGAFVGAGRGCWPGPGTPRRSVWLRTRKLRRGERWLWRRLCWGTGLHRLRAFGL